MHADTLNLVARVTREKTPANARFQVREVYQLWGNGQVTIDHSVEEDEWGGVEETRRLAAANDYPRDFFKAGFDRLINQSGSMQEQPL